MVSPIPSANIFAKEGEKTIPLSNISEEDKRKIKEETESTATGQTNRQKIITDAEVKKAYGINRVEGTTLDPIEGLLSPGMKDADFSVTSIDKDLLGVKKQPYSIVSNTGELLPNALKPSGFRKIDSTPTDFEESMVGLQLEQPKKIGRQRLQAGTILVNLPVDSEEGIEGSPGAGIRKATREGRTLLKEDTQQVIPVYINIQDMTKDEILESVNDLKKGHAVRSRYGIKNFPFKSSERYPLTFTNYGTDVRVKKTIDESGNVFNPFTKFKENPKLTITKKLVSKGTELVDIFYSLPLMGVDYGVASAKMGVNYMTNFVRLAQGKVKWGEFLTNTDYLRKNAAIVNQRDQQMASTFNSQNMAVKWIASGQELTNEDIINGAVPHSYDDIMGMIFDNRMLFPEDFITNLGVGRAAYEVFDRILLPIVSRGKRGIYAMKEYKNLFAGDVNLKTSGDLGKDLVRVKEWAEQNNKQWLSGKDLWIRSEMSRYKGLGINQKKTTLEKEWNNLDQYTRSPYITKSFQHYMDLRKQKEGGFFGKFTNMFRESRFTGSMSPKAWAKQNKLEETYATAGGMLLENVGIPAGYFIGGIGGSITAPNVNSKNFFLRRKEAATGVGKNIIGGIGLAVDAAGNLSAESAADAVIYAFTKNAPFRKLDYESKKSEILKANPDLAGADLNRAVWESYGVIDLEDSIKLPRFFYYNEDGDLELAVEGSQEHASLYRFVEKLNTEMSDSQKTLIKEEMQLHLQIQTEVADLIEKFPYVDPRTKVEVAPEDHPLNNITSTLTDVIELATTRDLALGLADDTVFKSFGDAYSFGKLERMYQTRRKAIKDASALLEQATQFVTPDEFSENTQGVIRSISKFLREEEDLVNEIENTAAPAKEFWNMLFDKNKITPSDLSLEEAPEAIQNYYKRLGINAAISDLETVKKVANEANRNYRIKVKKFQDTLTNPDIWQPNRRSKKYTEIIQAKNEQIEQQATSIYSVLQSDKFKKFNIQGDDVDEFFINTIDSIKNNPLEKFMGANVRHKHGAYLIFNEQTGIVHQRFKNYLREEYGEDIDLNDALSQFKEQFDDVADIENYNFKRSVDFYEFLVKNKNNPIVKDLMDNDVGKIKLNLETIATFDKVYRGEITKLKTQLKTGVGDTAKISETLDKYVGLLGRQTPEKEDYIAGTLKEIIGSRKGTENLINALHLIPKNYATAVATRRWGTHNELFEQIKRVDTPAPNTKGFEDRISGIRYRKTSDEILSEVGKMIFENPQKAANMLREKFGSVARVPVEDGSVVTNYVIATAEDATLLRDYSTLALQEYVKKNVQKIIGDAGPEDMYSPEMMSKLNEFIGESYFDGGTMYNALRNFNQRFIHVEGTEVWDGTLKENGELNFVDINNTSFSLDTEGKEMPFGKYKDQKQKIFYDLDETTEKIIEGDYNHTLKYDKEANKAYTEYKKSRDKAELKYTLKANEDRTLNSKAFKALSNYVEKTFQPKAKMPGQDISPDMKKAADYLFESGDTRYVEDFEKFLVDTFTKQKHKFVDANGKSVSSQEAARHFIGYGLREYFFDAVTVDTGMTRIIYDAKDGKKMSQASVNIPDQQIVRERVKILRPLLEKYLHPDPERSKALVNLYEVMAMRFAIPSASGADRGFVTGKLARAARNIPSIMRAESVATRGFNFNRGIIGPRWLALEMGFRAARLGKAGTLKTMLTTSVDMDVLVDGELKSLLEVLHDTIILNKFTPTNVNILYNKLPELLARADVQSEQYEEGNKVSFVESMLSGKPRTDQEKAEQAIPSVFERKEKEPLYKQELKRLEIIQ